MEEADGVIAELQAVKSSLEQGLLGVYSSIGPLTRWLVSSLYGFLDPLDVERPVRQQISPAHVMKVLSYRNHLIKRLQNAYARLTLGVLLVDDIQLIVRRGDGLQGAIQRMSHAYLADCIEQGRVWTAAYAQAGLFAKFLQEVSESGEGSKYGAYRGKSEEEQIWYHFSVWMLFAKAEKIAEVGTILHQVTTCLRATHGGFICE